MLTLLRGAFSHDFSDAFDGGIPGTDPVLVGAFSHAYDDGFDV